MRRFRRFTNFLVLAFVISMMLPDDWYDYSHFGAVPLGAVLLAVLCVALAIDLLINPALVTPWLWGGSVALMAMAVIGYLRGNIDAYSIKFFVADLFCFVALLAGYAVACTRSRDDNAQLVFRIAAVSSAVIVVTYIALFLGLVSTKIDIPGRTVTVSIFNAIGPVAMLLPWASVSGAKLRPKGWHLGLFFGITVGAGLLSATRSIVISAAGIAFLYLILKRRRLGATFLFRLCGVFVLLGMAFLSGARFGAFTFQRLNTTQLDEESRWEELTVWWPQIRGDVAAGQGMGSRFESNIVVEGDPLASATHIGIMTFLMKGGVILFLAYAVLPMIGALRVILSRGFSEKQRGAAGSVLMFIGMSCLSGGWFPLSLFIYGLAISSMTAERRSRATSGLYRYRDWSLEDSRAEGAHQTVLPVPQRGGVI